MKKNARNIAIFTYTTILFVTATLLFSFTFPKKNTISNNANTNENNEKIILPSGTKYKKVEYGQSFSISDLFSINPDEKLNLTIKTSNYSLTKVGTTDISVTFKKNNVISSGLIRLTVVDTQKPVIKLQDTTVNEGVAFDVLTGVTAEDNADKDLTAKLTVTGTADTNTPGKYKLSYEVKDSSGNVAHSDRNITVIQTVKEVIDQQTNLNNSTASESSQQETPAVTTVANENTNTSITSPNPVSAPLATNNLIIAGVTIPYQNGGQSAGQSIIDSNSYGTVSTWGGASVQSGSDGMNTHFIGHNPGIFTLLFSVGVGSPIIVTDSSGQTMTYTVNNILHLDDYGCDLNTKVNCWDLAVGTGGGERITLQTCITDSENLMVFASK